MAKRKKLEELNIPTDVVNNTPNKYYAADELDKQLDAFGKNIVAMMTYGTMPELVELSWQVYEKFKNGEIKDLTGTDDELRAFFEFKKKDLIIKLLGFMEIASNTLLDPAKMRGASIKEITHSLKLTLDMLNALHGTTPPKKVEHTHKIESVQDLDERIAKTKEQLDAIDADYEEVQHDSSRI